MAKQQSEAPSKSSKDSKKRNAAAQQIRLDGQVKAAYAVDPATALAPFLAEPYKRHGLRMRVTPVAAEALQGSDQAWIWSLLEKNMRPVYGEEAWVRGGEGKDKTDALVEHDARYLVVYDAGAVVVDGAASTTSAGGSPLGFVHYR